MGTTAMEPVAMETTALDTALDTTTLDIDRASASAGVEVEKGTDSESMGSNPASIAMATEGGGSEDGKRVDEECKLTLDWSSGHFTVLRSCTVEPD